MFPEGRIVDFLIVGVVALIVVGPKDLPVLMRKVGQFMARMRGMAAEFRASFDEMARQSELDELRREVDALRAGVPATSLGIEAHAETQKVFDDIHAGLRGEHPTVPPAPAPGPAMDYMYPARFPPTMPAAEPIAAETGPAESRQGPVLTALDDDSEIEASRAPLLEHLVELRRRLIICALALIVGFLFCFAFSRQIYIVLLHPFEVGAGLMAAQKARGVPHGPFDLLLILLGVHPAPHSVEQLKLVFTAPLEFFFTKAKLAVFGAIVITFPVLAWQLYRFVAPGLYRRERQAFLPFLIASPLLFALGAALVYFIMLPFVLWFSLNQQIVDAGNVSVQLLPKVCDYLSLVTTLLLAFGLCFQLPVVLALLGLAGIVNAQLLRSGRRYAIVGVFAVAAVLTPPDPISMLSLALPISLLYEISIWCVVLIEGRRARESA